MDSGQRPGSKWPMLETSAGQVPGANTFFSYPYLLYYLRAIQQRVPAQRTVESWQCRKVLMHSGLDRPLVLSRCPYEPVLAVPECGGWHHRATTSSTYSY